MPIVETMQEAVQEAKKIDPSAELFKKATELYIEVEIPERDDRMFLARLGKEAGQTAHVGQEGLLRQHNRGYSARIYFNAPESVVKQLAMFEYIPREGETRGNFRPKYRYRLDSNALFWKLVRNGFTLGANGA